MIGINEDLMMFLSNIKRSCVPIELILETEKTVNTLGKGKMAFLIAYDHSMPSQID